MESGNPNERKEEAAPRAPEAPRLSPATVLEKNLPIEFNLKSPGAMQISNVFKGLIEKRSQERASSPLASGTHPEASK